MGNGDNSDERCRILRSTQVRADVCDIHGVSSDLPLRVLWQRGKRRIEEFYELVFFSFLYSKRSIAILKTAMTRPNRIIQIASGPAPTMIGKGPMNMTAPKLAESL